MSQNSALIHPLRLAVVLIGCLVGLMFSEHAHGATITIRPTNLLGGLRLGSDAKVIRAVNERNQAVNSGANITTRATGEIDIVISDPQVRSVTLEVVNSVALAANLQNILVIDQTVSVTLPDRPCRHSYCGRRWCFHRRCR